jgi:hypothetical protein
MRGQMEHLLEKVAAARTVAVRDSKDPGGPVLAFGPCAWAAFTADVKTGTADA